MDVQLSKQKVSDLLKSEYIKVGAKVMATIFFSTIPVWWENVTYIDERTRC